MDDEDSLPNPSSRCGFFTHLCGAVAAALLAAGPAAPALDQGARMTWPQGNAVVSYTNERALEQALARHPAAVVRRLPALRVVEVRPRGDIERFASRLAAEPGIDGVERAASRHSLVEPALVAAPHGRSLPVAVLGRARRPGSAGDRAGRGRDHDRGDRHGSRPARPGRGGKVAAHIQRPRPEHRRDRCERTRDVRRGARGRVRLERRRRRRCRGRRETAGRPGERAATARSPTSTRRPRSSTRSTTARASST